MFDNIEKQKYDKAGSSRMREEARGLGYQQVLTADDDTRRLAETSLQSKIYQYAEKVVDNRILTLPTPKLASFLPFNRTKVTRPRKYKRRCARI